MTRWMSNWEENDTPGSGGQSGQQRARTDLGGEQDPQEDPGTPSTSEDTEDPSPQEQLPTPAPSRDDTPEEPQTPPDGVSTPSEAQESPQGPLDTPTESPEVSMSEPAQQEREEATPPSGVPPSGEQDLRRSSRNRNPSSRALEAQAVRDDFGPRALARISAIQSIESGHIFAAASIELRGQELDPVPLSHTAARKHQYSSEWIAAELREILRLKDRGVYERVTIESTRGANSTNRRTRPLPLKWVYDYKLNKNGKLRAYKARLCVRGDLQPDHGRDTYAATLAARTFRVLAAIGAKFGLEIKQYDIESAFMDPDLDEDVWVELPPGHYERGYLWKLRKALYGLRISPFLWFKYLSKILKELGLEPATEDPCVYTNGRIIVLFFVDDILMMFRPEYQYEWKQLEQALKNRVRLTGGSDIAAFLKIRVIRDRAQRALWLCQDQYIERITKAYGLDDGTCPSVPVTTKLSKNETPQSGAFITLYQSKVGSILYAACQTRPDVMMPASELARHNLNPGQRHMEAADQCIRYLNATRTYAIMYSGLSNQFECYSDAAFADDPETRKSSHGYLMKLFGGPVMWKAGKQDTVTTSSTEAELLAVASTAKEALSMSRLFEQIQLDLDEGLTLLCDNLQTIRLLTAEQATLTTKLRHIDIHRHWLRQEVQNSVISIDWIPTAKMAADGLTKLLDKGKFSAFVNMLGLVDAKEKIAQQQAADEAVEDS